MGEKDKLSQENLLTQANFLSKITFFNIWFVMLHFKIWLRFLNKNIDIIKFNATKTQDMSNILLSHATLVSILY